MKHSSTADSAVPDRAWLRRFRSGVRRWYAQHARPLPWRATRDPYQIWISEIMLQQTTVAAVVPYYERFLARFPRLEDLAAASEDEVLRYWEGLGYYSRGRNLRKTAGIILEEHGGVFPSAVSELMKLPGIGRYTAGAIASFAFDRPAPIVEANTLRLYCRLLGYRDDPRSTAGQKLLWDFAGQLVPDTAAGAFNQALMELGGQVCKPEQPECGRCPVSAECAAHLHQLQAVVPRAAVRPEITAVTEFAALVRRGDAYLLLKRSPGERWAGLWDFLRFTEETGRAELPVSAGSSQTRRAGGKKSRGGPDLFGEHAQQQAAEAVTRRELASRIQERTGLVVEVGPLLTELRHSVTRYRITLRCYGAEWQAGEVVNGAGQAAECRWVTPDRFDELALSTTGRQLARMLAGEAG